MTDVVDEPVAGGKGAEEAPPTSATPGSAMDPGTLVTLAPDVADSLGDYLRAWWKRIRGGESGALPIIIGLIVICIFFDVQSSAFFTSANIVNLFVQAAFIILLGMAELYALILSEIDLSVGFVGAVGAAIALALIGAPTNWPWWAGLIVGLAACFVIGAFQGAIITRLKIPSFVVTLAGLLGWQGVLIYVFDTDKGATGGVINVTNSVIDDLVSGNMTPAAGWILLVVAVGLFALTSILSTGRRRSQGLSAPPLGITLATVGAVAVAGVVLVFVCNLNRGVLTPVQGVPWVIPVLVVVVVAQSFMLARTRLGRYMYAIGASPEAARSRRHPCGTGPDHHLRALQLRRRTGRRRLRLPPGLPFRRVRRGYLCPLCGGRCSDRRGEPVRRARQADSPGPGWPRHRHAYQWARAAQHQHGGNRHRHRRRPARRCRRGLHAAPERSFERGLTPEAAVAVPSRRAHDAPIVACRAALLTVGWAAPALGATAAPASSPSWTVYHGGTRREWSGHIGRLRGRRLARLDLPRPRRRNCTANRSSQVGGSTWPPRTTRWTPCPPARVRWCGRPTSERRCRRPRSPAATSLPAWGSPARR